MDDLLKLIETLRERIRSHQAQLRTNEALTRSVLIDPLLRALGWDTEDPAQVVPEFGVPETNTKAEYALFVGSAEPVMIVEAKKLGERLEGGADQAIGYCIRNGYKYFAVTDGCEWRLYETHRPTKLQEKIVTRFDIGKGFRSDVCLNALYLWKQRFVEGIPVTIVPGPNTEVMAMVDRLEPQHPAADSANQDQSSDWVPLSKLAPESGESPLELLLPSGDILGITTWSELVPKLTKWLIDAGHLVGGNLPIRAGTKYLVAAQAKHSDGKPFKNSKRAGQFFVETNFNAGAHAKNMRIIIESAGRQADEFKVRTRRSNRND
ncbi:MAG: hypothetical protein OXJ53_11390 [Gammaproteobacteria bacterium]|nr:hypothetical protein [Gammaproteobacteria bacterium]MDE0270410.1 hypothetical protein [Gammaproteobacteria bacterium]